MYRLETGIVDESMDALSMSYINPMYLCDTSTVYNHDIESMRHSEFNIQESTFVGRRLQRLNTIQEEKEKENMQLKLEKLKTENS
jgi:hypothetical protein